MSAQEVVSVPQDTPVDDGRRRTHLRGVQLDAGVVAIQEASPGADFAGILLIFFYIIVLVPDFFATEDPEFTESLQAFIPPQPLHLFDGGSFSPWVPAVVGKRNPVTLRMDG